MYFDVDKQPIIISNSRTNNCIYISVAKLIYVEHDSNGFDFYISKRRNLNFADFYTVPKSRTDVIKPMGAWCSG